MIECWSSLHGVWSTLCMLQLRGSRGSMLPGKFENMSSWKAIRKHFWLKLQMLHVLTTCTVTKDLILESDHLWWVTSHPIHSFGSVPDIYGFFYHTFTKYNIYTYTKFNVKGKHSSSYWMQLLIRKEYVGIDHCYKR